MAEITAGTFKGQRSWVIRSPLIEATILPDLGTKLASLIHRRTGRELIYQRDDWSVFPSPPYGAVFTDYDLSGFDDMFPTIDVCPYPGGSWDGTILPDHGEVWAVPWSTRVADGALIAVVYGWRLPYRLEKRVWLSRDNALRIDYQATNLVDEDLHVLWAAHPLCTCNESTRIILPPGVDRVVNAYPGSRRFARYAAEAAWPEMTTVDGARHRLDRVGPASLGLAEKYWVDGRLPAGWGVLQHTDTHEALGFAFPVATVPYLGVWLTEGGLAGHYHVALEPGTAAMDRPDVARRWGRGWVLPARATVSWYLTLAVGQQPVISGVTADGELLA